MEPSSVGYDTSQYGEHHGPVKTVPNYWNYGALGYNEFSPPWPLPKKLYHVTPFPKKILQEGFRTFTDPKEQTFGGHGEYVSLTSLPNARIYKEALKDFIRVANGMINIHNIQAFIEKWKIRPGWFESIQREHEERNLDWQKAIEEGIGNANVYSDEFPYFCMASSTLPRFRNFSPEEVGILEVETSPSKWHSGVNMFNTDKKGIYTVQRTEDEWRIYSPERLKAVGIVS